MRLPTWWRLEICRMDMHCPISSRMMRNSRSWRAARDSSGSRRPRERYRRRQRRAAVPPRSPPGSLYGRTSRQTEINL